MPWSLNKRGARFGTLTSVEQRKYDAFQNAIHRDGMHPKDAADAAGDTNYKKLRGTSDQYEIRLSQGCRATFLVNEGTQTVTILQVGGHT